MNNRTVTTLLLFAAAVIATSVLLALVVFVGVRAELPLGPWTLPGTALLTFVPIFFFGRRSVLPPAYSKPALRALAIITVCMGLSMAAAVGLAWIITPFAVAIGFGPSAVVMWLGCAVVTRALLERASAKPRPAVIP
jgi:hypothetical protein